MGTAPYYYHNDHLGTPMLMTDSSLSVVWQGEFKPFGEPISVIGSITNNLRFPGQYFDSETGLYQNWWRDYKPEIGRYTQADPSGLAGGLNVYIYVWNSPSNLIDSSGLDANTWTYGEIREWAIYSLKDFSSPAGLADAKASIAAVCGRGNPCNSVNGSGAVAPGDQAAWKNIINANGGTDRSGGGNLMCVGTQNCWFAHRCYKCCGGKKKLVERDNNLQPCGSATVSSTRGGTLYFYNDPLQGWCTAQDRNSGCK